MFSSLLPNVSSNMKFTQNGASKQPSNRFSVRVFKAGSNTAFPHTLSAKPDLTYRAPPPPQQHNPNWYNNAPYNTYDHHQPQSQAQRPRTGGSGGGGFSIYPSATGDTFIYEQSSCSKSDIFSTSEPDSPSSTTTFSPSSFFSPALSNDSTLTLGTEPERAEPAMEEQQRERTMSGPSSGPGPSPVARAPSRSGYAAAPQGPAPAPLSSSLSRTASTSYHHHMHEAQAESIEEQQHRSRQASLPPRSSTPFLAPGAGVGVLPQQMPVTANMARVPSMGAGVSIGGGMTIGPDGVIQVPEYEPSTFSEMEVLERDRIATINAGYNAASSAAYFAGSTLPAGPDITMNMNMRPLSTSPTPRPIPMSVPMPMPMPMPGPQTSPTSGREYLARVASSQPPLHPNLSSYNAPLIHDSPPSVERIPSGSAPEYSHQQAAPRPNTPSPRQQHTSPPTASAPYNTSKPEPPRAAPYEYRTSPNNMPDPFDVGPVPSSRSARSTYATSAPETMVSQQEYQQERDRDRGRDRSPLNDTRRRRPSVGGPRPDLAGLRQSSDVRDYGSSSADYRQHDFPPPKSASESSSSTLRGSDRERERERERGENGYNRDRRDVGPSTPIREVSPHTSHHHSSRNASQVGSELRREARTPAPREAEDFRPQAPSRRNSAYVSDAATSPRDGRPQYKSGPLTSSPTQMRLSPLDPTSDNERSHERTRTRSSSFSHPTRPSFPIQTPSSDSRYTSDHERSRRSNDRPNYKEEERHLSRAELDRRGSDQHPPSSQAYYSQTSTIPLPTVYDGHPTPHQSSSSSRAVDQSASSQQPAVYSSSHSRSPAAQEPPSSSRFRVTNAGPDYPSDGERPYATTSSHQASRSAATSYDKHPNPSSTSTAKYADPASARDANRTSTPTGPPGSEPTQRRYSDGDQKPPVKNQISGKNSTPALRSVRWNENLICPSPVFSSQRRKGWFNRKGDQLWTNHGQYKAAPAGQEYPADLNDYPEEGEGWMNEEGIRIDVNHRLIPKAPLRSALKQTRIN